MSDEEIVGVRGRVAPENLGTSYLLSAGYDGAQKRAYVRLYEPNEQQIYLWYDNKNHLPYLISKKSEDELKENERVTGHTGFVGFQEVEKYDSLYDQMIPVTKIVAQDPLSIGGGGGCIRAMLEESWESRIRYYACYIYDMGLVPGMPYKVVDGELVADDWSMPPETEAAFNAVLEGSEERFVEPMKEWARLLQMPVPDLSLIHI